MIEYENLNKSNINNRNFSVIYNCTIDATKFNVVDLLKDFYKIISSKNDIKKENIKILFYQYYLFPS